MILPSEKKSTALSRRFGTHARIIDFLCLIIIVAVLALGCSRLVMIRACFLSAREHLRHIEAVVGANPSAALKPDGLHTIEEELSGAEADLQAIRGRVRPLLSLAPYLAWIPLIGGDIETAPLLLEIAIDMAEAGRLVCQGAEPVADLLTERPLGSLLVEGFDEELLSALSAERSKFLAAQALLNRAAARLGEVDRAVLSPRMVGYVDQLDRYLPLFQIGTQGAILAPELAPDLMGLDKPRTYLVLTQNNHELRATGGFITAVGLLRVDKGRISTTGFRDSYLFDDPTRSYSPPPKALTRTMRAGVWVLRDANWSPDFPTTARVAGEMYQLGQGVAVDGVIAVDLTAIEYIVGAIGPIQIEAYGEEVSQEDLMDKLKSYWASPLAQEGQWWNHRKDFMAALAESVFTKLETELDHRQGMNLLIALWKSLEEKHLLIYADDPDTERFLAEHNWDGTIRPGEGDYLLVVDTNVGYNKVDQKVERALDYQVVIGDDGRARGQVTVSYANKSSVAVDRCVQEAKFQPSYDQMMEGCYWDYLRLYVPEGSHITWATEVPLPQGSLLSQAGEVRADDGGPTVEPPEGGKAVFSQFFVVAPSQQQEINFQYDLPFETLQEEGNSRYQLLIQKQPGTLAVPVHLAVTLPTSARLIAAQPQPTRVHANVVEFETVLSTDRHFVLVWY